MRRFSVKVDEKVETSSLTRISIWLNEKEKNTSVTRIRIMLNEKDDITEVLIKMMITRTDEHVIKLQN